MFIPPVQHITDKIIVSQERTQVRVSNGPGTLFLYLEKLSTYKNLVL